MNHTAVKEIVYDSFGNITEDSNESFKIPLGFAGGLQNRETGLVHFGYREYDPFTGRWTAKDPIGFDGGDTNLYGYVLNDPVNLVDPWGLAPDSLKKKLKNIIGICKNGKIDCNKLLTKGRNYCIKNGGFGMYICMQATTELYGKCMFDGISCGDDKNESCNK